MITHTDAARTVRFSNRRLATAAILCTLAAAAWAATADWMSGMDMNGQLTIGSFRFFVGLWVVMMSAMMFPSVWPSVSMFGLVSHRRQPAGARSHGLSTAFVLGYLASWTAFGITAFGLLAVARQSLLESLSDTEFARYVVAPIAIAAATYQVVPFKQACLRHCRGPLSFFLDHWRDGRSGAFAMGARHGAYCVGCCWMLMLVLLAVGVMSIAWMAIVSLAIAIEKLAPPRAAQLASGLLAFGLVALTLLALARPSWLPGIDGGGMTEMSEGNSRENAA